MAADPDGGSALGALGWLVRKDLLRFFADRQGALMAVLVPVVLASLLGMLFAPREATEAIRLLVADADRSERSRAFVTALARSGSFVVEETDAAAARARLEAGTASVALLLPPGTGAALRASRMFAAEQLRTELLFDPSREIEAKLARGLLTQLLMEQTMQGLSGGNGMRELFDDLAADTAQTATPALRDFVRAGQKLADSNRGEPERGERERGDAAAVRPPLALVPTAVAAKGAGAGYNSYAHTFAGMLLLFLLFGAQSAAKTLVNERSEGALTRVRLAPVRPWVVLLATGQSSMAIALINSAVVYAVGMLVFGVRVLGSPVGFLVVVVAQAAFVGGFALMLAGLGRTEQQIASIGSFVVLVVSFAGGAMLPSFLMPEWLQSLSQVLPTYWATKGLAAMTWRGLPLSAALAPTAVLLGCAIGCGAIGIARFRWE
jgi:ABC-2 type transport system permease protein